MQTEKSQPEGKQLMPKTRFTTFLALSVGLGVGIDQQNRVLEAATVTLRYSTALCPPMGKMQELVGLHFLTKPGFFQANYCSVTKVEVPNCVLTCNMRNVIVAVRAYQAVKNPATTEEFAADFSFMPE